MGQFLRKYKKLFLILFVGASCMNAFVQSVAAASEWPLGMPDEYTMAWISISYRNRNGTVITEKSQVGKFGKGGKISAAGGVVVHVKSMKNGVVNNYGCEPFLNEVPNERWIALVQRGMCDFDVKLRNANAKKAAAMVVYDREESEILEDMKLTSSAIPGVFTFKSRGESIANLTEKGVRVDMHIIVGEVCTRPYSGINRTSVLFVSISFIVLMVISLAWLIVYYVQRFRYLHAKDRLAQRLCTAAKKALAKIPTRIITRSNEELIENEDCCPVCIEIFKIAEVLRTLPCRHEFHKSCVDPWLLENRTCPMCKMDILKYYGYIFTGSQESILQLDVEADGETSESSAESSTAPTPENEMAHSGSPVLHQSPSIQDIDSRPESPIDHPCKVVPHYQSSLTRPSLLSLTVVATQNGIKTSLTANPENGDESPVKSLNSLGSDGLVKSLSEHSGMYKSVTENIATSRSNSLTLIPSASSNEYPGSSQSPTSSLKMERPTSMITTPKPTSHGQSSEPLLSPDDIFSSSENVSMAVQEGSYATGEFSGKFPSDSSSVKSGQLDLEGSFDECFLEECVVQRSEGATTPVPASSLTPSADNETD